MSELKYFVIYKPYGVLSQFTSEGGHPGLGTLADFPKDVYTVGRLDHDSEGLLILTNDNLLHARLPNPAFAHSRTYYVQVEGDITDEALQMLSEGVEININGKKHFTKTAVAHRIEDDPELPERVPPIRYRASIPDTWISLTITEGKNRQVRRMTAKVGFPTLRLVRYSIEKLTISGMQSGEVRELSREEMMKLIGLKGKR